MPGEKIQCVLKVVNDGTLAVTKEIELISMDQKTKNRDIGKLVPRESRLVSYIFKVWHRKGSIIINDNCLYQNKNTEKWWARVFLR